ncbi:hypothetical protein CBA19CS11_30860 [Caballeronia novacaledonica]|nr:hypothetical protein CBA19CS11_30860 [Caballeronia novacaledonica]
MKLELRIDSKPLEVELDDVIAALLARRLDLPDDANLEDALARYLARKVRPGCLTKSICVGVFSVA